MLVEQVARLRRPRGARLAAALMVAQAFARLRRGLFAGRGFRVRLGGPNANVHEPGTVLKGGRHCLKYASELLPIKN
jgi:hypothetical protein